MKQIGQAVRKFNNNHSYIDMVHNNSKGWITKARIISGNFSQWHYKYQELLQEELDGENVYISLNTFFSTYRRVEFLKELKAHFIDLDVYNTKFTKDQILMHLEAEHFGRTIPRPNLIIDSGRGFYLIWLINTVPSKALPLWKAIEEYLYSVLKPFGADRQALDPTRVLRVPGSINSKSNSIVKIIEEYEYIYDLREIQSEYLPELEERKAKKKGRPKKIVYVHRERSLYYARIQDITKLCELREYDLRGHREFILFLYRYYLCYFLEDTQKALQDVLELNREFILPLSEREVIKATRSAEKVYLTKDKDYKYKSQTLIELLEITEYEETHMTTIISNKEFKRRKKIRNQKNYQEQLNAKGKITEKEKLSQRRVKIKDLLAEGLKQKDICSQLNISKDTYIRDRKILKEQGII